MLGLKTKFAITVDATKVNVTEYVGAYNVGTNEGGWGSPNEELSTSCLFCFGIRKDSEGDQILEAVTPSLVYDPTALNSKETTFTLKWKNDGVHDFVIGRLPVSNDGANLIAPVAAIPMNSYFYYAGAAYQKTAGGNVLISDLSVLYENEDINQTICSDAPFPRLAVQMQKMYKEYRVLRRTECDDAESLYQQIQKLTTDLQGAYYAFKSNTPTEAQDQFESLIEQYQLVDA